MANPNRTRPHNVGIRMNDDEKAYLEQLVQETGQTKRSLILNALSGATIATPETVEELRQINRNFKDASDLFRGETTNLNQIAHNLNLLAKVLQDEHPDAVKVNSLIGSLPNPDFIEQLAQYTLNYRKEIDSLWRSLRLLTNQQKLVQVSETLPSTSCETTK